MAAFVQIVITECFDRKEGITEAFSIEEDITLKSSSIDIIAKTDDMDCFGLTNEYMKKVCENVFSVYDNSLNLFEPGKCVKATGVYGDYDMTMTAGRYDRSRGVYLHIRAFSEKPFGKDYESLKNKMENKIADISHEYITYTKINGYANSRYSYDKCMQVADRILKKYTAKKISFHTGNVCVIYGYSEKMPFHVMENGNKVNLQISFSYNELNRVTEICVATPIINEAY